MGTERNALAAMNADIRFPGGIKVDRIHRTRRSTLAATDTELLSHEDSSAFALGVSTGGTGPGAGGGVTSKTGLCLKTAGEPSGGHDPDSGGIPGKELVDNACTRKGA